MSDEAGAQWKKAIASVFTAVAALLCIYRDIAAYTVKTWMDNGTYTHGFLIFPITLWLVWRRRETLSATSPSPDYRGIIPIALCALLWQLGYQAGAIVVEQYSLVLMIIATVWTLLGSEVFRQITFPMFFLLFSVPFGEALIPWMMNFTADFTVAALQFTGIPVYREGTFFSLPSGNWSVVEACSGLRYFVSSLTLGVLYAYLTYNSTWRRLIFVAASALIPIIANGLRAYMIVMIGHLSGMKLAVGVDHLIYGWLFFGIVMLLLFWLGSFFREDKNSQSVAAHESKTSTRQAALPSHFIPALIAILVPVLASPLYAAHLDKILNAPIALSLSAPSGPWQPDPRPLTDWFPHYLGSRTSLSQTYTREGKAVFLFIGYYRNQSRGFELVTSTNQLVTTRDGKWGNVGETRQDIIVDNEHLPLVEAGLRSPLQRLLVWQWYWVDGQWVINPYLAKLLEAKERLLHGRDDASVVILATPLQEKVAAEAALKDFATQMLPGIASSLTHAVKAVHAE